jgi:DNA-directed RNA polymerase alpha subunit
MLPLQIQAMDYDELVALRDRVDAEIKRRWPPVEEKDIREIGLTPRAENALLLAGFERVGNLLALSAGQLRTLPGMGKVSFTSVIEQLDGLGLSLRRSG